MNDPTNLRIKWIGDSHSAMTFGQTVLDAIVDSDANIHFLAFSGLKFQYCTDWSANTQPLTILNFESRPDRLPEFSKDPMQLGQEFYINDADVLVIALGTNDIYECISRGISFEKKIGPRIETELKKITVKKIFVVEPPLLGIDVDFSIRNQLMDLVKKRGASIIPCGGHRADQDDGIHMNKEMARSYGNYVAKEVLKLIFPHH